MRVTGEGVGDHLPDGLDHLGGRLLALERAVVGTAFRPTSVFKPLDMQTNYLLSLLYLLFRK